MEVILIILVVLVGLIVLYFRSSHYLKLRLDWLKEDLSNLPNTRVSLSLIEKISKMLSGDFNREQREKARNLIQEACNFLERSVPCYPEQHELPTFEERSNPDFKCSKCNGKHQCVFFHG